MFPWTDSALLVAVCYTSKCLSVRVYVLNRAVQVNILINNAVICEGKNVGKSTDSVTQFEVTLFKAPFENI